MALFLSPIGNEQQIDSNGDPLNGGKIQTYLAGSTTATATYTDNTGGTAQANPIILNSLGLPSSPIWLTGGITYKFVIKDSADVTLRTVDNISGINDTTATQTEWVASGFVPTFISTVSFSVPGDQTGVLQIGRRLQTQNTAGTIYSRITNSVFAATITTVTVVNDSGVLDSGLSSVAYGVAAPISPSLPNSVAVRDTMGITTARQNQEGIAYTTAGTSTAYTLTPSPAITAYAANQSFFVNFNAASGAAPTLAISGVATPPNLVKQIGDGTYANIAANDIPINHRSRVTLLSATQALVEDMPSLTLDIGQFSRCVGQSSKPNAATPLTKYDLFADVVVFYNSVGGTTVRRVAPGTITNDLGLAGVTANGRDQAGAFTADSFVYLYWIWNGSAVATISSLAAPPTGPALPTGYTHWCFATVVRWNASSNIVPSWTKGRQVWYDIADGGVTRIISGGAATSMTAAGAGNFIPALATYVKFTALFSLTHSSIASFTLSVRPTGALNAGQAVLAITIPVAGGSGTVAAQFELPNSANTQIDYKLSAAPTSGGAFVDILGYTIPNGDV